MTSVINIGLNMACAVSQSEAEQLMTVSRGSVLVWSSHLKLHLNTVLNLLQVLDLVLVGDECRLVDAVTTDQQLVVQSKSQVCQTETLLQGEVQSLDRKHKQIRVWTGQVGWCGLTEVGLRLVGLKSDPK